MRAPEVLPQIAYGLAFPSIPFCWSAISYGPVPPCLELAMENSHGGSPYGYLVFETGTVVLGLHITTR